MKQLNKIINDQLVAVKELEEATTRVERLEIKETIDEMEKEINKLRKEMELD